MWEHVFRNSLLKEKDNVPLIVYNFLLVKLKERISDITFISLKNGKSFSHNFIKYIHQCKSFVNKFSTINIGNSIGENGILSTTIKLSNINSFIFSSSFKDSKELNFNRNFSRFKEIKDTSIKSVPINKKNFPVNIFLHTSNKLDNRPTEKYEVFLGKYVRSYLVNDAQDPINKRIPLSRKDSKIYGTIHNHVLNKDNIRTINNISRTKYETKSESRNTNSLKLPISLTKSRSRPNLLFNDSIFKTKTIETVKISPFKIEVSKFNQKSFNIQRTKKKGEILKCFKKEDFYYF